MLLPGGMLTAHFGLLRFLSVDVGVETAVRSHPQREFRETGATLGLRVIPNPGGRFRLVLPVRVGGLILADQPEGFGISRRVQLTADGGVGLSIRLIGPVFATAIARLQLRHTPGDREREWVGKGDAGLTFLF